MKAYVRVKQVLTAERWFKAGDAEGVTVNPALPLGSNTPLLCGICQQGLSEHGALPLPKDHPNRRKGETHYMVCPGDFIITGHNGSRFPVAPQAFFDTYELCDEKGNALPDGRAVIQGENTDFYVSDGS